MNIKYFINNCICPELKSLILQYTLSTPIKEELLEMFEKRKHIKYKWIDLDCEWYYSLGVYPEWIRIFVIKNKEQKIKIQLIEEQLGRTNVINVRTRIGIIPYIKQC